MTSEIIVDARNNRVERWQESMADRFLPLTLKDVGAQFWMSARIGVAGGLKLAEVRTSAIRVERNRGLASRSESDCYKLLFQLSGQGRIEQTHASLTVRPGEWAIYDATRPYVIECSDHAHLVAVLIPPNDSSAWRWSVDRSAAGVRQIGGNARLALESLRYFLAGEVPEDADSIAGFERSTLTLLDSVIRREVRETLATGDSRAASIRIRAESFISNHFSNPELTPERLAKALNVSRRTLYNAFAATQQTPQALIQEFRLQASRRALEDPLDQSRNLIELATACGFSDGTHFGRVFKQRFGHSPGAHRALGQRS
ncbi:helix-turn-helix domain-containing protein [Burkholderia cepacia]|uniref:helix-turn-helix domain-containing protein n=1 Tax=Burkholderia cepacia TaxID=292 RepID=UPI0009C154CF|nr:helix-turn-helix domain-containing protein [Burkholderia cepacia]